MIARDDAGAVAAATGRFPAASQEEFSALLRLIKESSGLTAGQIATKAKLPRSTAYHFVSSRNTRLPKDPGQVSAFLRACNLPPAQVAEVMRIWSNLREQRQSRRPDPVLDLDETSQANHVSGPQRIRAVRLVNSSVRFDDCPHDSRNRSDWSEVVGTVLHSWDRTIRAMLLTLAAAACLAVLFSLVALSDSGADLTTLVSGLSLAAIAIAVNRKRMGFWKTILGLARRRSIGVPLLVVALGTAALAHFLAPTHYVSSTTMVLILTTPSSGGSPSHDDPTKPTGLTNPLLNFDDSLKTMAGMIIRAMNTPETMNSLGAGSGSATSVTIDYGHTNPDMRGVDGPFVYIEGDSTLADDARSVVVRAQQLARTELESQQKAVGALPITFVTMADIVPPSAPKPRTGAKWQAAGIAVVLCIGVGMIGAYTWYRLTERRRTKPVPRPAQPLREVDPTTIRTWPVSSVEPNGAAPVPATTARVAQAPRRWPARLTRIGTRVSDKLPAATPAKREAPQPAGYAAPGRVHGHIRAVEAQQAIVGEPENSGRPP